MNNEIQKIKIAGKDLIVSVRRLSPLGMIRGLMFRSAETRNLLFSFSEDTHMSIHSYFVFFTFLAVWLDASDRIMETRLVNPFTSLVTPKKPYRKLVEIPLNRDTNKLIRFIVGKERFK